MILEEFRALEETLVNVSKVVVKVRAHAEDKRVELLGRALFDLVGVTRALMGVVQSTQAEVRSVSNDVGDHLLNHEEKDKALKELNEALDRHLEEQEDEEAEHQICKNMDSEE